VQWLQCLCGKWKDFVRQDFKPCRKLSKIDEALAAGLFGIELQYMLFSLWKLTVTGQKATD